MITLTASDVVKAYGATRALNGLTMRLVSGEVTGIAGPNGAGKSTMARLLAGEENPDSGLIRLERDGVAVAERWRRVAVVHQEAQLWSNLTVRQNLAVGREARSIRGIRPAEDAEAPLNILGIAQFAEFVLSDLSLAVQQRVEIARAMMSHADVYLFDEPNSALTDDESRALFATMDTLADSGKIVLLITHRLNDFVHSCRRVLILRDGRIRQEMSGSAITETAIAAALMAGERQEGTSTASAQPLVTSVSSRAVEPLLSLSRLSDEKSRFRNISLDIAAGRILALAGVEGSGARELLRAIGAGLPGVRPPMAQWRQGASVAFVAASRRHTIFPNLTVGQNLVSRLGWARLSDPLPILSGRKLGKRAAAAVAKYHIKARSHRDPVVSLSGGNQQKVAVGAALELDPNVLVLEEPTRGVDISSKREIYALLRAGSRQGKAVVLFCTEVPEMFALADTIIVMSRGNLVAMIDVASVASVADLANLLAEYEAAGSSETSKEDVVMGG